MAITNHLDALLQGNTISGLQKLQWVVMEDSLAGRAVECLALAGSPRSVTLVMDTHTHAALGARIEQEIASSVHVNSVVFQGSPMPDRVHAAQVQEAALASDMVVAVGSGTINDLCKYGAFLAGKPYAVFPTAPSMNGYISANASILKTGHKHSLAAALPVGVYCDMEILAAAPQRLIRSGFGDIMCRSTAQTDWFLSHLLLDTPYRWEAFEMLRPYETKLAKRAKKLPGADKETIRVLLEALLVSGLGMVMAGGSMPASQGEHLIAHCMEMMLPHDAPPSYHGEQIAVATMTMAAIQDTFLTYVPNSLKDKNPDDMIAAYFGPSLRESTHAEYTKKQLHEATRLAVNKKIILQWPDIAKKLWTVHVPEKRLRKLLESAGCPTRPEDIGWNAVDYEKAVTHAHFIRDRFTFLDVAYLTR